MHSNQSFCLNKYSRLVENNIFLVGERETEMKK